MAITVGGLHTPHRDFGEDELEREAELDRSDLEKGRVNAKRPKAGKCLGKERK